MSFLKRLQLALMFITSHAAATPPMHVWETKELTFICKNTYKNAYTDVTVWIDLSGPNFKRRVCGFWDGGDTFRVRLVATQQSLPYDLHK